jgi:hypothetical protein
MPDENGANAPGVAPVFPLVLPLLLETEIICPCWLYGTLFL